MSKDDHQSRPCSSAAQRSKLSEIKILVPDNLAAAWQRCSWVLIQEKKQNRLESMEEMVRDFLVKHGC